MPSEQHSNSKLFSVAVLTQKLSKRLLVLGHQGVDRLLPLDQRRQVHLEEGRVEQELEGVALPGLARVVVVGQRRQQLGRGEVARLVGAVVAPEVGNHVQQDGTQNRNDLGAKKNFFKLLTTGRLDDFPTNACPTFEAIG